MTNALAQARADLVARCHHLAAAGLSPGSSGNASVRAGETVLMTPTGSAFSRLSEDALAEIALSDGDAQIAEGPRPSKELPLHLAVYRRRPDVTAVLHLHSPYATAIACLPATDEGYANLPALTPYRVMRLGNIPVAAYARPGSEELAVGVARHAASNVMLLANHGSLVSGSSITAVADLAEELETAAQLTFLLNGAGAVTLTEEAVAALTTT